MVSARTLSAIFRSGDLPFRPRRLAMYWVVQTVKNDPIRTVEVYRDLMRSGGTNHAAETFLALLKQERRTPFQFWFELIYQPRLERKHS